MARSPIAEHPDGPQLPADTKALLERLANVSRVEVAIVTGRGLDDIKRRVGIANITCVGTPRL